MPASPFRGPYPLSSIAASGYWQGGHDNLKKLYVWPLALPKADMLILGHKYASIFCDARNRMFGHFVSDTLGLSNVHTSMDAAFALRMFHVEH